MKKRVRFIISLATIATIVFVGILIACDGNTGGGNTKTGGKNNETGGETTATVTSNSKKLSMCQFILICLIA